MYAIMRALPSPAPDSVLRDAAFLQLLTGRLTATRATQIQSVVIGGLGTLAVVGLWLAWFPSLRRVDRLDAVGASHS